LSTIEGSVAAFIGTGGQWQWSNTGTGGRHDEVVDDVTTGFDGFLCFDG